MHTLSYDYYRLESDVTSGGSTVGSDTMKWIHDPWSGRVTESQMRTGGVNGTVDWKTKYQWDDLGQLLQEKQGKAAVQHVWDFEYGFSGELLSVDYPSVLGLTNGVFDYDSAGRLDDVEYWDGSTQVADYDFSYSGLRLDTRTESLVDLKLDLDYDDYGRLTELEWSHDTGGGTWVARDGQLRAFDDASRVIMRKRTPDTTGEVFVHDGFGRMKSWYQGVSNPTSYTSGVPTSWTEVEDYTLNKVYGRSKVEVTPNGGSTTTTNYTSSNASAHFYTQVGSETRSSWNGRLDDDGTYKYLYDAWGRLTQVKDTNTGTVLRDHTYDARGRRVYESAYDPSTQTTTNTRLPVLGGCGSLARTRTRRRRATCAPTVTRAGRTRRPSCESRPPAQPTATTNWRAISRAASWR